VLRPRVALEHALPRLRSQPAAAFGSSTASQTAREIASVPATRIAAPSQDSPTWSRSRHDLCRRPYSRPSSASRRTGCRRVRDVRRDENVGGSQMERRVLWRTSPVGSPRRRTLRAPLAPPASGPSPTRRKWTLLARAHSASVLIVRARTSTPCVNACR
jgi:hypothetical protein